VFTTAFEIALSEFEKVFPSLHGVDTPKESFHISELLAVVKKYQRWPAFISQVSTL